MASITSLYSAAQTATPGDEGIFESIIVKGNEVDLYWPSYVCGPGYFLIKRKACRKPGRYEVRGITRDRQFHDYVPTGEWFKYRLEFVAD